MHAFSPTFCKGPFLCTFVRFLLIFYPLLRAFSPIFCKGLFIRAFYPHFVKVCFYVRFHRRFVTVCFYAIYCGRSIYLKTKINWSPGLVVKGPSQMIGCVSTEIKKFVFWWKWTMVLVVPCRFCSRLYLV